VRLELLKASVRTCDGGSLGTDRQTMGVGEADTSPSRREDNHGRPWHGMRIVLHEVLWMLGRGAQWSEMPAKYPPYQTCHRRFQQWV